MLVSEDDMQEFDGEQEPVPEATGYVVDTDRGTTSLGMPVPSLVAHGHGMWEFPAVSELPSAEVLLSQIDETIEEGAENVEP